MQFYGNFLFVWLNNEICLLTPALVILNLVRCLLSNIILNIKQTLSYNNSFLVKSTKKTNKKFRKTCAFVCVPRWRHSWRPHTLRPVQSSPAPDTGQSVLHRAPQTIPSFELSLYTTHNISINIVPLFEYKKKRNFI